MKKYVGFICFLLVAAVVWGETSIPGGEVSGCWAAAGSPYLVQGSITVTENHSLTIYPGCTVVFQGHYYLDVLGQLLVLGSAQDSVRFTVADTTGFYDPDTNAGGWGGIRFLERDEPGPQSLIRHSVITYGKNIASSYDYRYGGGMRVRDNASVVIEDCRFSHNYAYSGGALSVYNSSASAQCSINRCVFSHNRAYYSGGACSLLDDTKICNSLFVFNTSQIGSVVYGKYYDDIQLFNNTICYNTTTYSSSGAIVLNGIADSEIINNIIWYNTGGQVYTSNNGSFSYNNIQGGVPNYPNYDETNIDIEPSFVEGSYQLKPFSICANRGTPDATALQLGAVDLAGNPRIYNGTASRIDIGAYEYQGEVEPLFPDFEADHTTGVVPFSVQFTDLSQGDIDEWHWDLDGDGEVDSYEQHPTFTYQETGAFAVSLTIWRDGESVTCLKQNFIQTGLPQTSFDYFFHITKDTAHDELRSLHLADMDEDGLDEIYLLYINDEEDYWKIQGYDHQGQCILNHSEPQLIGKIRLFEWSDEFYIITSKIGNYYIDMKVYRIPDFAEVASLYNTLNSDYYYAIRDLQVDCSSGMPIIYQGLKIGWDYEYGGSSHTNLLTFDFNGSTIGYLNESGGKGYQIFPNTNLTTNYSDWWDDMGGGGDGLSFSELDGESFLSLEEPGLCTLIGDDDGSYINYGAIVYISGDYQAPVLRNYSPDYQTVLWQRDLPLSSGHYAAANVSYNGEDWYLLLFDHTSEYVHIIDRYSGETVAGHFTLRKPFSLKKTATDGMLLFEKKDGGYDVYTNDSHYYTSIHQHEVPQPPQDVYLVNYPNPFNPSTEIMFNLTAKDAEAAKIEIFNIKGQKVKQLSISNDQLLGGMSSRPREARGLVRRPSDKERRVEISSSVTWDGTDSNHQPVASGVYFYRLVVNHKSVAQKKMMMIK